MEKEIYHFECLKSLRNIPELQLQEYCNILKELKEEFVAHRFRECHSYASSRPRWSRGYHTRLWIRGSLVRSRPGSSVNILSMTSFGREVKPWVPCRIFPQEPQAEIRTSEQNLSAFSRSMSEATLMTSDVSKCRKTQQQYDSSFDLFPNPMQINIMDDTDTWGCLIPNSTCMCSSVRASLWPKITNQFWSPLVNITFWSNEQAFFQNQSIANFGKMFTVMTVL